METRADAPYQEEGGGDAAKLLISGESNEISWGMERVGRERRLIMRNGF